MEAMMWGMVVTVLFILAAGIGFWQGWRSEKQREVQAVGRTQPAAPDDENIDRYVDMLRNRVAYLNAAHATGKHPLWAGPDVLCDSCGVVIGLGDEFTTNEMGEVVHPWNCVESWALWEQPPSEAEKDEDYR